MRNLMAFFTTLVLLVGTPTRALALDNPERQELAGINLMAKKNPGFENAKAGWVASGGSFTLATSGANLFTGGASGVFNASAASQTLSGALVPVGKFSAGSFSCWLKTDATDYKLQVYDGSVVLNERVIPALSSFTKFAVPFMMPTSGSVRGRIISQSNAGDLAVDNCFLGSSEGIQLTQATVVGSVNFAQTTNCQWAVTSATLAAFGTDSDCPAPTVVTNAGPGTISTVDADLPQVTITDLPRGNYVVVMTAPLIASGPLLGEVAINDGTTTRGNTPIDVNSGASKSTVVSGVFSYTSSGSRTFALHGSTTSGTLSIPNNGPSAASGGLKVELYRYPDSSEQAFTAGTVAQSFTAQHADDCQFIDTSTSYVDPTIDASCTFSQTAQNMTVSPLLSGSDDLAGIVLGGLVVGKRYKICADRVMYNSSATQYSRARFTFDGTPTATGSTENYGDATRSVSGCAIYTPTATTGTIRLQVAVSGGNGGVTGGGGSVPAISWYGHALDEQVPAPVFAGSLMTPSNGVSNIVGVAFSGDSGFTTACTSDPCTIARQTGGVSSVNWSATGEYVVNIAAGVFSSAPMCTTGGAGVGVGEFGAIDAATATTVTIKAINTAGTFANSKMNVICVGPK